VTTFLPDSLQTIVGLVVGRARIRAGSFLLLDLGASRPSRTASSDDPLIWIYMAAWQLTREEQIVAASEDDRDSMQDASDRLVGERVYSVLSEGPAMDLTIQFEKHCLRTFAIHSSLSEECGEEAEWAVWLPSGEVVSATPNGAVIESARSSDLTRQMANMDRY
jgi:hypothetical protein